MNQRGKLLYRDDIKPIELDVKHYFPGDSSDGIKSAFDDYL